MAATSLGGMVTDRVLAIGGTPVVRPICTFTLTVDHRVADGAQAGRFLQELKKLLENPVNLLLG